MTELQKVFSGLGLGGVRTYLQSGNVVFHAIQSDKFRLAAAIEAGITQETGHAVPVLVMSAKDLNRVANSNPLCQGEAGEEKLLHSIFLFQPVAPRSFEALSLPAAPGERAVLVGSTILLRCPQGYGKTKLHNGYFERMLGAPATTRNWRTVLALQKLCATP